MTSVLLLASETSRSSAIFVSHSNPSCFLAAKATKTHSAQCLEKRLFRNLAVGYCIEGDGSGLHLRHCQEQLGRILLQDLPILFCYLSMSFGIFPTFHPLKRPNTCACVQCRISTRVMAMTGRGCLSSLPSSSSSLLAIGLVL